MQAEHVPVRVSNHAAFCEPSTQTWFDRLQPRQVIVGGPTAARPGTTESVELGHELINGFSEQRGLLGSRGSGRDLSITAARAFGNRSATAMSGSEPGAGVLCARDDQRRCADLAQPVG